MKAKPRQRGPGERDPDAGCRIRALKRLWAGGLWLAVSSTADAADPFSGVQPDVPEEPVARSAPGWRDNLLFRKEIYWAEIAGADDFQDTHDVYSRLSAGFEIQKRFATATRTVASIDYQGRVVFRDHWLDTASDPMGMDASPWEYETHNAYAEFYNLAGEPGRFHLRAGRYYLPFGLNWQTDTHGTLLQLSNDRVFGTDRDWQATAYGNATEVLDYMAGYVLGTGPEEQLDGQSGMAVGRIGLGNAFLFEQGLEGGLSGAYGERLVPYSGTQDPVSTWRAGVDIRKQFDTGIGPFTLTGEGALGEDESSPVRSGLAQLDWLNPGRRWGAAAQYFHSEREPGADFLTDDTDARASFVLTRYFRNDVGSANLHWIAFGLERQIQTPEGDEDTLLTLQYYRYW